MRIGILFSNPYSYKAFPATLHTFSIPPVAEKTLSVKNKILLIKYIYESTESHIVHKGQKTQLKFSCVS